MRKASLIILAILFVAVAAPKAQADGVYTSLSLWQAAAPTYTETSNLGVSNGAFVSSATLADATNLTFNQTLQVVSIGAGWGTWSGGYTGQVLESYGTGSPLTTETWSIAPTSAFGMFLELDQYSSFLITVMLNTGATISQDVVGNSGASFFGWTGTDVTGVTITSSTDFAAGDFYSSPIVTPEPGSITLMVSGLALLGSMIVFRKG